MECATPRNFFESFPPIPCRPFSIGIVKTGSPDIPPLVSFDHPFTALNNSVMHAVDWLTCTPTSDPDTSHTRKGAQSMASHNHDSFVVTSSIRTHPFRGGQEYIS